MGNIISKTNEISIIKRIEEEDKRLKEYEKYKGPQIKEPEETHIEFIKEI